MWEKCKQSNMNTSNQRKLRDIDEAYAITLHFRFLIYNFLIIDGDHERSIIRPVVRAL